MIKVRRRVVVAGRREPAESKGKSLGVVVSRPSIAVRHHPLDELRDRYAADPRPGGYVWIPNLIGMEEPIGFDGQMDLRRATLDESQEIRFLLRYWGPRRAHHNPWETRSVEVPSDLDAPSKQYKRELLPEEEWRYHIAAYHQVANQPVFRLRDASVMAQGIVLEYGYSLSRPSGHMFGVGSSRSSNRLVENFPPEATAFGYLSGEDAQDLVGVYDLLKSLRRCDDHFKPIDRGTSEYLSLLNVRHPRVRFLGYFAVLESLIVHKPKPTDPYDSITRQVGKKMVLLGRRFARGLDYALFVHSSPDVETVWKKMYELRSNVAHGSVPDFDRLSILKDMQNAELLVREAVRSVLRQLLEEPLLLADLREC